MTSSPRIYLDHNSTTPLEARVAEAMQRAMNAGFVNPASQHAQGQAARRELERAREEIAELLGARTQGMHADRVIFTSGGTEANHLALFGLAGRMPCRVIVSSLEHPSVIGAAEELVRRGFTVDRIRAKERGTIELEHLRELLDRSPETKLVSVMFANNETGVIQPVAEIAAVCRERGVTFHTDAVQAVGKVEVNFTSLDTVAMTVAPHKFYGPVGIGALIVRYEAAMEPLFFGGFQQGGLRPGTESVMLAVGFAAALRLAKQEAEPRRLQLASLRDRFEARLTSELADVAMNGMDSPRLPNTSNIAFLGVDRQQLLLALDNVGISCSTGSACASGSSEPSPVLSAMGLNRAIIESSLRFSFGIANTPAEVDSAVDRISECVKHLRRRKSAAKPPAASR